jgi:outer membrane protein assembly factor BamB
MSPAKGKLWTLGLDCFSKGSLRFIPFRGYPRRNSHMSLFRLFAALVSICLVFGSSSVQAGSHWPQFRGPNASGISDTDKPPINFGPGTNVVFKTPIPSGASSPCIWEDRIFLTGIDEEKLWTLCYSARNGELLWKQQALYEKLEAYHRSEGSPAASTPATDGKRVYSFFGSSGIFVYSLDGKALWEHRMPTADHVGDFGTGTSPVVSDGLVLVNRDMLRGSHLLALNAATGDIVWRVERPEFVSSYSSPIIWEHDGAREVVLAGMHRLKGYELKSGEERWQVRGLPNATCATPVLGEGMLYFAGWSPGGQESPMPTHAQLLERHDKNSDGFITKDEGDGLIKTLFTYFDLNADARVDREEWEKRAQDRTKAENVLIAVRPGNGDITESNIAWKYTRGLPYVPSPLYYRGLVYIVKDGGLVSCFDAKSGKAHFEQERLGPSGSYYPSPVAANGLIYFCSNEGKFTVLAAGEKLTLLGHAELGERCITTPAIAHDRLYVRSAKHLWAFGEKASY